MNFPQPPADLFFSINKIVVEAQVADEAVDNPNEASDSIMGTVWSIR